MRDITLEDTFHHDFTTRAFATGIPTTLSGTPVISAKEGGNATPITAGVSVAADTASVTGLNEITVVATAANGFEAGKSYSLYISTGTVDSVSAVGEVVGQFTIGLSAAAIDLANGTDGLGVLKTSLDDIPTVAEFNARTLVAASYFDPAADTVVNVTNVATLTGHTVQTGDSFARLGAPAGASVSADILVIDNFVDGLETTIGVAGAGLSDLGGMSTGMKAEVLVEVNAALDAAISELGVAAPTATPTIRTGLMLLYMALRNKTVVQTSGTDALEIYNNAGTKIASKLLTDDGSDYTEAEML